MAAGRGIVGSDAGGIAEMLENGNSGRTIVPRKRAIAAAVTELLLDPELRMRFGRAARERLNHAYSGGRVGELQEASYARAIERRRALGPRPSRRVATASS
jgi:glycosyltransferase involved in cell wall biosynthesis